MKKEGVGTGWGWGRGVDVSRGVKERESHYIDKRCKNQSKYTVAILFHSVYPIRRVISLLDSYSSAFG